MTIERSVGGFQIHRLMFVQRLKHSSLTLISTLQIINWIMIILIFKPSGSMELKLFTLCERCCLPLQPHPTPTPSSWFSTLSPSASRLHPAKVFPSPGAQFQVSPHPLDLPEIAPPRPTRYCLSRHPMCFLRSTYHDLQLSYLSAPS